MFKKILIILFVIVTFAISGAYFFFSSKLNNEGREQLLCKELQVTLLDSLDNVFISVADVESMVDTLVLGKYLDSIDTHYIEQFLIGKDVIDSANAYYSMPNKVIIEVTQRKPIIRFQLEEFGFYADESGFILPLISKHPLNLPIVTGHLPFEIDKSFRGYTNEQIWMNNIISITNFIQNNAYWCKEIEQIHIEENGDLIFYPKARPFKVVFGGFDNKEKKFEKLAVFYKAIMSDTTKNYSVVNLKFKDQIVCK